MRITKKVAILVLLIIFINAVFGFCFHSPSYMDLVLGEVQNPDKNYDIVFVGQSHGSNAFNPYVIEEETDMTTYNLCRGLVCVRDVEYLVKESTYKNDAKYIVYDIDSTYWTGFEYPNYFSDGYVFPHLNNPVNKVEYFLKYVLKENYRYNLFRYVLYGSGGLKAVPDNIKKKLSKEYWKQDINSIFSEREKSEYQGRGFFAGSVKDDGGFVPTQWDSADVKENSLQGFINMANYCKQNNIEFICVSSPLPKDRMQAENYSEFHNFISELTRSQGVTFWDFNYIKETCLSWDKDDFQDTEGHMFGAFADEYSKVLGRILDQYKDGKSVDDYFK